MNTATSTVTASSAPNYTGTINLNIVANTGGWSGGGAYILTITNGSANITPVAGTLSFAYNNGCCPPATFTATITSTGSGTTFTKSTGTLTVTINCDSIILTGSVQVLTTPITLNGNISINGSGCFCGCGSSKTATLSNVILSGAL